MELNIRGLRKKFDEKQVLKNIDYSFEQGKIYALLGRNGAGKTTFFNCLNKDTKTDSGEILLNDSPLNNEDIGYLLSTIHVPDFLSGREFLEFFIEANLEYIENVKTIDEYFKILSFKEEDQNRLIKDYSHGMKVKMQMIVFIILKPKILLLDEPLTSFDVVSAEEIKQLLVEIKKDCILILSTHIMQLALDLADEIVLLSHGALSKVDKDELNSIELKTKIIELLKDEE